MSSPSFDQLKHVHIIGACGTLMGSFASFLKRRGLKVTGSDQNIYPPMSDVLQQAGVELFSGYRPENIKGLSTRPEIVIIGNVISAQNPEARFAIDQGYAYASLPEFMEKFMLPKTKNYVVAGTHGKTTTSSMLAFVLKELGADPSYVIGGVSHDLPHSFNVSVLADDRPFVLEGDEYDTAFWDKVPKFNHYLPDQVILTSVEFDHADIYADLAAVEKAFSGLVSRVRPGGKLIACLDYPSVDKLLAPAKVPVIRYGSLGTVGVTYAPQLKKADGQGITFDVLENGRAIAEISIQSPGNHNALNALAVWLIARENGFSPEAISRALSRFKGVKRRQEVRGEANGILVIDDFAHHPTAVRETVRALKSKYAGRRMVVVFEPRSATSRRKVFQKDYVEAFAQADFVILAKPFDQTKIAESDQFSSEQLLGDLKQRGKSVWLMESVDSGLPAVASQLKSGDVVAVLSNGGFDGFIPKLLTHLKSTP